MREIKIRSRLIAAGLALAVALIMLVTASLAWLTVSARPEIGGLQVSLFTGKALLISDSENGSYAQTLDLSGHFSRFVELRPVSTLDGVNWYLPDYDSLGLLEDPSDFILDADTGSGFSHANVMNCDSSGVPLEGAALREARERGAFVYADIWLKTQEDYCEVRLSVPARSAAELDEWERERAAYGTWALASYELEGDTLSLDARAQAALRVGFLTGVGTENRRFVIFEPNADMRSSPDKPEYASDGTGRYVAGYYKDDANYLDGYYIPTRPIGRGGDGRGALADIDGADLVIQLKSEWDGDRLRQVLLEGQRPGSNEVSHMGLFVKNSGALLRAAAESENGTAAPGEDPDNISIVSDTYIVRLEKDVPQRVRLFIWIEGQDADCWNDIATGSFIINLELAGETR